MEVIEFFRVIADKDKTAPKELFAVISRQANPHDVAPAHERSRPAKERDQPASSETAKHFLAVAQGEWIKPYAGPAQESAAVYFADINFRCLPVHHSLNGRSKFERNVKSPAI